MKLFTLFTLLLLLYILVGYLAISFAPPEAFYTKDWREAAQYQRDCKGGAKVEELVDEWKITCKESK